MRDGLGKTIAYSVKENRVLIIIIIIFIFLLLLFLGANAFCSRPLGRSIQTIHVGWSSAAHAPTRWMRAARCFSLGGSSSCWKG